MKAYIATGLTNHARHNFVRDALLQIGVELTYDWTFHGPVWSQGKERIRSVSVEELKGVVDADVVIVILPGSRGTHAELGMALARRKPVLLLVNSETRHMLEAVPETCSFYHHPLIIPCYSIESVLHHVKRTHR